MKTYTFSRLWLLSWIDRRQIKTWPLVLILLFVGIVVGRLFAFFSIDHIGDDFPLTDTEQQLMVLAIPFYASFTNIALVFLLGRSSEATLLKLIATNRTLEGLKQRLSPSPRLLLLSFMLAVPVYLAMLLASSTGEASFFAFLAEVLAGGSVLSFYVFVAMPLWLVGSLAPCLAVTLGHFFVLRELAERIEIDLLNLQSLSSFSVPFVRIVMATALLITIVQLFDLANGTDLGAEIATMTLAVSLLMGLLLLLYGWPVWLLRGRIRAAKQHQLDAIRRAFDADISGLSQVLGVAPGEIPTKGELLTRQMFIESRWEWPIEEHLQKLIIFALLPPLTWVLAAMVENAMF